MKYLHSIPVVHRDLKPSNILLDSNLYPYIGDMGEAKLITNLSKELNSFKGTFFYMAPEIPEGKYNYTCDIYSYAILFYQLFTKQEPFDIVLYPDIFSFSSAIGKGLRPDLRIIKQDEIKDFLSRCWSSDTTKRIPFDQIVEILKSKRFRAIFGVTIH